MELVSTEESHAGSGHSMTSRPNTSSGDDDVDNERLDNGIFDYTNNNNNNNNNSDSGEKERRRDEQIACEAPTSPDQQLSGACSVTSASPSTPDSSPRDSNVSHVDDSYNMETSTPLKQDSRDIDAVSAHLAFCHSADLTDRASERSSTASDYGIPSNPFFPEAAGVYQQYASLKTSPFLSSSMSTPVKGVAALGGGLRCPPVREAVDPAKYITISGEPDGVKYACSKCGNIYKWRKSLNKHWKEKHDGETPDPAAVSAAASRYVRLPTSVAAKRPSPAFTAASSATRPTGVRGSLAAILPPLPSQSAGGFGLRHSPVNGREWNQSESILLQSAQLKTPTFADYKTSSNVSASPFSVLAVDSVSGKERPVDLSGSASRAQTNDDGLDYGGVVLDLSKKGVAPYVSSQASSVQDEPIDFSTKTASRSVRNPTLETGYYQTTLGDRPLELAHAGGVAVTSLNCAQCRQKFTVPSKLNRHFAETHLDMLHVTAATAAGDASCGGSTQLFRYLTTEQSATRGAIRCVVCGTAFCRRSAAAKHFDQEHFGLYPNPYQSSVGLGSGGANGNARSSTQRCPTSVGHKLPGTGNKFRCSRCPFTTDSFSMLARHHLRHSPRRSSDPLAAEVNRMLWSGAGGGVDADDMKVAELQLLSGTAMNMDDVIGENTAIVIPQAPEETAPAVAVPSSISSKPFKQTSSGARSSGGRSKRADVAGSSTASAETLLPFKCELCEYRARWPSEMTQHAKNHSDEKPYHCPQCTYRSKWKWDVVKHLKRCGGGGTAHDVIDTTNLSTSSSSSVVTVATATGSQSARRRRTSVRSLLIDVPPAHAPSSYERSLGSVTKNSTQSAVTSVLSSTVSPREHLSNGPPNVMVCSRIQDTGSERAQAHEAVHTIADTVMPTVQTKPTDSASPTEPATSLVNQGLHYCLQCSFVGHSPAELRRHLRVHSDEKPYSCRTCCYSSKWKCDLKKHLRAYNHVSAVPLAYGGHGRKPTADWQAAKDSVDVAAHELSGPTDDSNDIPGDTTATPDSGSQSGVCSSLKSNVRDGVLTKTQRIPNGSNFAGITAGGRLRCRRCDFEAIDLTSFLQHKSSHASVRKDENGDQQGFLTAAAAAARPSHHRRKSSKQVRVPPESKTEKYANKTSPVDDHGRQHNDCTKVPDDDHVNVPDAVDGSKFWTSLGLRSRNGVSCVQSAETVDVKGSSVMDLTADSDQKEQHTTMTETELKTASPGSQSPPCDANVHEMAEAAADDVTPSPASSSSDTDVDYADVDQPVDLCRRPNVDHDDVTKLDSDILTKPIASQAVQQMSDVTQRITTSEADDSTGMSKRKRKLRTCDKCGYVTDNLTTLQRHVAKHGSTGRHRCTQCDYTVDRQHILEYHVKNVHVPGTTPSPGVTSSADNVDDQKTAMDQSDDEATAVDAGQFQKDVARCWPPVKHRRIQGSDRDQVMAAYRCISCGYSGYSVGAVARHRLRHSAWSLPYRCEQCPHRATTRRLLTKHMKTHDRQTVTTADDEQQHVCNYCPYKSLSASHVAAHERFHGASRRYSCPYCSYSLDSGRRLMQHRRLHARDCRTAQLRCAHADCPFTCHDRGQLMSHCRQHAATGRRRRPHTCDRCSFAVDSRSALLHHRRLHDQRH